MLMPPYQRRCKKCLTCVDDAFANGRDLGGALGPLSRCSKHGRDRTRRLSPDSRLGSVPTNHSATAFDPCPGFNEAAFEDPYATLTSSPAFDPAPTSYNGPTFGPAAITCAGPPPSAGLVASSGPPTDFNLTPYAAPATGLAAMATSGLGGVIAPYYPPPVAFTSAPINPLGADGYVTGPIVTCAAYFPDGYPPGYTPGSGSAFTGGSGQGAFNGGSMGAPWRQTTVNPQDLLLPNDISSAVTGPHLLIPSGQPVTGLGCFSERTGSKWQCQHLSQRISDYGDAIHTVCGHCCDSERELIEHYNSWHGPVNILLPDFWHPCGNCDAFNVDFSRCLGCGREAVAADSRWVCASVGVGPTAPGHVTIGLSPPPPAHIDDDNIFEGIAPELYNLFGFPSMPFSTLRPIFQTGNVFSRTFYACLEDGLRFRDGDVEDDDDEY